VVNLVNGTGVDLVKPLCASKVPRLLTCIGSTVMGCRMIQYSATSIKVRIEKSSTRSQHALCSYCCSLLLDACLPPLPSSMLAYPLSLPHQRFSLELGGDAPVLLFADADVDKAIADFVGLKFANGGQVLPMYCSPMYCRCICSPMYCRCICSPMYCRLYCSPMYCRCIVVQCIADVYVVQCIADVYVVQCITDVYVVQCIADCISR
jgi:hypothetical protein